MKTNHFFISLFLTLLLLSCNDELMNSTSGISSSTRAAGDNMYDLLGYGYDCTFSAFRGSMYGKARFIDLDRFLSGKGHDPITRKEISMAPGNINESLLHNGGEVNVDWGSNIEDYAKGFSSKYTVSAEVNKVGIKLYSADIKTFINDSTRYGSSYCFYRINTQKPTRKLTMSEVYPNTLKYFLTDEFLDNLNNYTADQIVAKYGTHVLTDILLGGVSSAVFNAKMTSTMNTSAFKSEADLFIRLVTAESSVTETQSRFKEFKDINISIKSYGGTVAIDQPNISFDPFTGKLGSVSFNYTNWLNSVTRNSEQLIGLGNNTTKTYLISEFIDDPVKKSKVEEAIVKYCKEQGINASTVQSFDYEDAIIYFDFPDSSTKLACLAMMDLDLHFGPNSGAVYNRSDIPQNMENVVQTPDTYFKVIWTIYPYGEYYRIGVKSKSGKVYALSSAPVNMPVFNESSLEQLWKLESLGNNNYMLKNVQSGSYFGHNLQFYPKNPNDPSLWYHVYIKKREL